MCMCACVCVYGNHRNNYTMSGSFWQALGDEMLWKDMRSFQKADTIIIYSAIASTLCVAETKDPLIPL